MVKILKISIILTIFIYAAHMGFPLLSSAAKVAGDDATVPTVALPARPDIAPVPQAPVNREAPDSFPKTLKRKEPPVQAPPARLSATPLAPPEVPPQTQPVSPEPPPAAAATPAEPPASDENTASPVDSSSVQKAATEPPAAKTAEVKPPAPVIQEQKQAPKDTRYVTIDFDNVDIQVFVKFVSELTGRNFVIDDKVRGKVTIISPRKISINEVYKVFESVLEVYGFATVTAGDVTKIVPSLQAREKQLETKVGKGGGDPEDKIVTQIISLEYANPDEVKKVLDPLISRSSIVLSYPPTGMLVITDFYSNIKKVLEIIGALDIEGVAAQITYLPLQAASAPEISKAITELFKPQPGRVVMAPVRVVADERANAIILVASEMDTERVKKLIELMDKDVPKSDAMLRVYRLQNAVAEDLAKVLMNIPKDTKAPDQKGKSPLLSKDVQVTADKATNTLIITANKNDYKVLEDVIKSLDVSRPMVYIEALIMEVSATKDFQVGVEWRGIKDTGATSGFPDSGTAAFISSGTTGLIPSATIGTSGASLSGLPGGFAMGILGAGINIGGVAFPSIGAVLQAFRGDSDVSVLSTPQLMTVDNEEAEINVSQNIPYITRQDTSSNITTTAGGINYSSYEYKDVGVKLNITPHINEENMVRLKLEQTVSNVVSATNKDGVALPTTLKREAKTVVVVKDRETIVIGGLLSDNNSVNTSKVPCLGNIPILGWLFKTMSEKREKTNLYVFLTPHIVRTQEDAAAIYNDKRSEMGEVREGIIKLNKAKVPQYPSSRNYVPAEGDPDGNK